MKRLDAAILSLFSVVDSLLLFYSAVAGPFPSVVPLGSPTAYRNIYIHVPISIATYITFTLGFLGALLYLIRGDERFESLAHLSIKAGIVLGASTLVTGMIWARESWGAAWNWDPRETGILFMWLSFLIYLAVRSSIMDPDAKPRVSMAFAIAAYSTIPLSFAIPYLMPSLHPTILQTGMFLRGGLTRFLFTSRMLIVTLGAVLIILMGWRGKLNSRARYIAIPLLLAALLVAAVQLPPYVSQDIKGLVIGGTYNGTFYLDIQVNDSTYKVIYEGDPPVTPVKVTFEGKEYFTLKGHWVLIRGNKIDSFIRAKSLKLINYWGVSVNSLIYALTFLTLLTLLKRGEHE